MQEASIVAEMFKGLIAAGPVAGVLAMLCWTLWKQNVSLMEKLERQHDKMLRLAVRVQRAVEVLADIQNTDTEVDDVLDHEDERRRRDDRSHDRPRSD